MAFVKEKFVAALGMKGSGLFFNKLLMDVARKCHTEMRQKTERVITSMKVDDYADRAGRLTGAIASIEGKLGKPVKK